MSQEAQIFVVHETCQSVKEKYPGLKHKGDSDFTLNPHEAFQGCHFSAVRGTGLRSHWEPRRASPPCHPPPTFCLSLIKGSSPTYGSSGLQLRQCAACRAQRSPHRVRPPGRPCPGPSSVPPGQVLTRRRADVPGPLRDRPRLALSCRTPTRHGPIQRLAEFKFAHFRLRPGRHGCSAPPRRRGSGVKEEGLRLRRGFWGELTRGVSWDGCRRVRPGDLPRAPGTPNRPGLKISIPHANENASECLCWLPSPVRDSFTLQFPIVLGEFLLGPGVSVPFSGSQDDFFFLSPKCLEFLKEILSERFEKLPRGFRSFRPVKNIRPGVNSEQLIPESTNLNLISPKSFSSVSFKTQKISWISRIQTPGF